KGNEMLQTVIASNCQHVAATCVKPLSKSPGREESAKRSIDDLSMLYPGSVLKSSAPTGWHNVRAIHFRHNAKEVTMPASDDHCMLLNLGTPFFANVYPGKRRFEGQIGSGEVAIIPAGSSWTCRSEGTELPAMLLLYLRPLFVRSAARELNFSHMELGLPPQI